MTRRPMHTRPMVSPCRCSPGDSTRNLGLLPPTRAPAMLLLLGKCSLAAASFVSDRARELRLRVTTPL